MKLTILGGVVFVAVITAGLAAQGPDATTERTIMGCVKGDGTEANPWTLTGVIIPVPPPAAAPGGGGGGGRGGGVAAARRAAHRQRRAALRRRQARAPAGGGGGVAAARRRAAHHRRQAAHHRRQAAHHRRAMPARDAARAVVVVAAVVAPHRRVPRLRLRLRRTSS